MPGGDRTGPLGQGPMTGRAAGFCAGTNVPGYANPGDGRGFGGRGRGFGGGGGGGGRGRGWRNRFRASELSGRQVEPMEPAFSEASPDAPTEVGLLREQLRSLEQTMAAIRERLERLDAAGRRS